MGGIGKRWSAGLLAAAFLAAGCAKDDPERLAAVGRKVAEKFQSFRGESRDKVTLRWPTGGPFGDDAPLAHRVECRLHWERELAGAAIEVAVDGDTVELRGTVLSIAQGQRAMDLTRTTVGVGNAVDRLTLASQSP